MADLIDRQAALAELEERFDCHQKRSQRNIGGGFVEVHKEWAAMAMGVAECLDVVRKLPAVDAVEVVRCKDCRHGVWDEEENLWMCVFTADYDEELGVYHGFIQHNTADYYCADGKRREENAKET